MSGMAVMSGLAVVLGSPVATSAPSDVSSPSDASSPSEDAHTAPLAAGAVQPRRGHRVELENDQSKPLCSHSREDEKKVKSVSIRGIGGPSLDTVDRDGGAHGGAHDGRHGGDWAHP